MNFDSILQQIRRSRLEHCDVRHGEGQVWLGCSRKAENMSQREPCTVILTSSLFIPITWSNRLLRQIRSRKDDTSGFLGECNDFVREQSGSKAEQEVVRRYQLQM